MYIIYSDKLDRYYIGSAENTSIRVVQHNNSNGSKFTRRSNDWTLVYCEVFDTRSEAQSREYAVKRKKSRKHIEFLIGKG
ncbi:MAG: GIY-YIG nuclease family protein [Bacteroidota bacterium]